MAKNSTERYVAFLRGINVGGNKKVPMADLKKLLEKMGYANVKTFLASGNVLFDAEKTSKSELVTKIPAELKKKFGFEVGTIVRTHEEVVDLHKSNPFKGIKVTPETRLYVSFLSDHARKNTLKIPYKSKAGDVQILTATKSEVCSVVTVSDSNGTLDLMELLEKEFGKQITTRNWNTIEKIVET